ncbi:hypothetical protein T190_05120 [Sinorhizobium meliloti CCBAU 01290]|nr:hypothetical protein T190_05120 [Sinorhizobium meliloti CCBAU 01290]
MLTALRRKCVFQVFIGNPRSCQDLLGIGAPNDCQFIL